MNESKCTKQKFVITIYLSLNLIILNPLLEPINELINKPIYKPIFKPTSINNTIINHSINQSNNLPIKSYKPIYLKKPKNLSTSIYLSACLPVCLSVCLSIHPAIHHLSDWYLHNRISSILYIRRFPKMGVYTSKSSKTSPFLQF